MKKTRKRYPLNQCALYKCQSRKRLESILAIEPGDLRKIDSVINYHSFDIEKNGSSKKRRISAPGRILKAVQSRILFLIQSIERPEWLISGERGKCYIDNGKIHLNNDYLLAADIKSFYDNCRRDPVYRFFRETLLTSPDVAKILTDIVTYNNGIPTGCPTSQLIAYYAYADMFNEINICAEANNCRFTLYVDDMTFSSSVPFDVTKLSRSIECILIKYGHRLKRKKLRYYSKDKPKPITGTIVTPDHCLNVPNKLQQKVYNGFQLVKELKAQEDSGNLAKATQVLMGQLQASRNIEEGKFPEIVRLTNQINKNNRMSIVPKRGKRKNKGRKIRIR